jgi:hypothetical protein
MKPEASILISSFNRSNLLRRTLLLYRNPWPGRSFRSRGCRRRLDRGHRRAAPKFLVPLPLEARTRRHRQFEQATGLKKFHNNPSWTNNVAFPARRRRPHLPDGERGHRLGELLSTGCCTERACRKSVLASLLDDLRRARGIPGAPRRHGCTISRQWLSNNCKKWPLQSDDYRSDVTNYLSSRATHPLGEAGWLRRALSGRHRVRGQRFRPPLSLQFSAISTFSARPSVCTSPTAA